MPNKNCRARRAAAKGRRGDVETGCSLGGCGKYNTLTTPCCKTDICKDCVLNVLLVCTRSDPPNFVYICPFCMRESDMPKSLVKELMSECCPSHARLMDQCSRSTLGRAKAVVAHLPCKNGGCYECEHGYLAVHEFS